MIKILKELKGKEIVIRVSEFSHIERIEPIRTRFNKVHRSIFNLFDPVYIFEDDEKIYTFKQSQIKCIIIEKPKTKDDTKRD